MTLITILSMVYTMYSLIKLKSNFKNQFDPIKKTKLLLNKLNKSSPFMKAYLFGSGAYGKITIDSDLDILVIFSNEERLESAKKVVYSPSFSDVAVDWIFKTSSDFDKYKNYGGICFDAFHHGIEFSPKKPLKVKK